MKKPASKKIKNWDKIGMESRCSLNLIEFMNVNRFNFDYELSRLILKESVEDKLVALGLN